MNETKTMAKHRFSDKIALYATGATVTLPQAPDKTCDVIKHALRL